MGQAEIMKKLSKIMVVEDEVDIRAILEIIFAENTDISFEFCSSGHEALLKSSSFKPDLILLDVMMPEMDGIMTLHELRKMPATQKTPVIFMTAKAQDHEVRHYIELGAIDVIAKPFNPMKLQQNITHAWNRYQNISSQ